jgi:hypothetical protein
MADRYRQSFCTYLHYLHTYIYVHTYIHIRTYNIARPPTTSFAGINLAASIVQHPLQNCRLYYSQVTVDPQKSIDYVQRNRNKKVIYRSFVTNSWTNITAGSSFNALVNSGIVQHPTAVLICPFIGAVSGTGFGDF